MSKMKSHWNLDLVVKEERWLQCNLHATSGDAPSTNFSESRNLQELQFRQLSEPRLPPTDLGYCGQTIKFTVLKWVLPVSMICFFLNPVLNIYSNGEIKNLYAFPIMILQQLSFKLCVTFLFFSCPQQSRVEAVLSQQAAQQGASWGRSEKSRYSVRFFSSQKAFLIFLTYIIL